MKRQLLAVALGSMFALPVLANNEIDAGYTAPASISKQGAELAYVNAEQGYEFKTSSMSVKTREDVRAEVAQARRSGNFIVNAELGSTANSL